jgi:hypothetical protein
LYLEHFKVLQLAGFLLLVLGTLVFNEIVILPFLGFDKNTKAAIAMREKEAHGFLDNSGNKGETAYMAASPYATYDATRN